MENRIDDYLVDDIDLEDNRKLIQAIQKIKIEWDCDRDYFESVKEELLIDYAIFKERATRAKYMYLLKIAKEKGVSLQYTIK
ncbi:DUF2508 family protein [Clostridium grantii]|uniref:DUF2508 domain-containing protein n=1 Tax=Clostridium grantii DSM 8605 TaxID=1121316 RepID=A0A1M5XZV2_9CLOT|nr:DUF2508 family protein [Clostridium grantii]SHI05330.1 Protein of unknown function [Clostridium grantii DSM 8605]